MNEFVIGNNISLWFDLADFTQKDSRLKNSSKYNGHKIYIIPDAYHLLKNIRDTMHIINLTFQEIFFILKIYLFVP